MSKILMFVANGFEEIEAVTIIDILRRSDIECVICSITGELLIEGSHNIKIIADVLLKDMKIEELSESFDAVVLPGGIPGADTLRDDERVIDILNSFNSKGKITAAICAAPKVLERAGILMGKKVTFFPESIENESLLLYTGGSVEQDGTVITGKAAGAAAEFAFLLVRQLRNGEESDRIKKVMFY